MTLETNHELREIVRKKYSQIAKTRGSCRETSCCGGQEAGKSDYNMIGDAYEGISGYVADADLGLGCGVPVEHARLQPAQTVLDLGCGAGLDAFVARKEVGDSGQVIGVDMTAEMIARARANAQKSGFDNVEFRLGEIEHLPVVSDSVDVVISNCVLNLVPDKEKAYAEIFRVLKPGGHFCISDIVSSQPLPDCLKEVAEAYAGCVSGAIPKDDYLQIIDEAGFGQISVASERKIDVPADLLTSSLSQEQLKQITTDGIHIASVTVTAIKPQSGNI
jgi:ubiquinone/menaquinone biosynthesis C-methylase UbiE